MTVSLDIAPAPICPAPRTPRRAFKTRANWCMSARPGVGVSLGAAPLALMSRLLVVSLFFGVLHNEHETHYATTVQNTKCSGYRSGSSHCKRSRFCHPLRSLRSRARARVRDHARAIAYARPLSTVVTVVGCNNPLKNKRKRPLQSHYGGNQTVVGRAYLADIAGFLPTTPGCQQVVWPVRGRKAFQKLNHQPRIARPIVVGGLAACCRAFEEPYESAMKAAVGMVEDALRAEPWQ